MMNDDGITSDFPDLKSSYARRAQSSYERLFTNKRVTPTENFDDFLGLTVHSLILQKVTPKNAISFVAEILANEAGRGRNERELTDVLTSILSLHNRPSEEVRSIVGVYLYGGRSSKGDVFVTNGGLVPLEDAKRVVPEFGVLAYLTGSHDRNDPYKSSHGDEHLLTQALEKGRVRQGYVVEGYVAGQSPLARHR